MREETDLKLGIEADFIPGREDRMAELLAGRDFDYVVGSIHFVGDGALDYDKYDIWSAASSPEKVWQHVLRVAGARPRPAGCSTSSPTPTSSSTGAPPSARGPSRDLRYYYDIAMEGIAESGIAVEVSTAGLRKPVGELYPARAFLEMVLDAGNPIALSSDAHTPEDLGRDYDQALELLEDARGHRAGGLRAARAAAGADRMTATTGIGWDSHRLVAGRPLILGGVAIEHELGLDGHSDADVLTHAIIDALLGAAALGDIGQHFPDTDERYRDADSMLLLRTVVATLAERGLAVAHVDATVVMERPKLAPHRDAIRASLADGLGVAPEHVNVKASTGEGMGFVGRGEGVAALAVATVRQRAERDRAGPPGPRAARRAGRRLGPARRRLPLAGPVPDPARRSAARRSASSRASPTCSSTPTSC